MSEGGGDGEISFSCRSPMSFSFSLSRAAIFLILLSYRVKREMKRIAGDVGPF
jgi:hypothetical protein